MSTSPKPSAEQINSISLRATEIGLQLEDHFMEGIANNLTLLNEYITLVLTFTAPPLPTSTHHHSIPEQDF